MLDGTYIFTHPVIGLDTGVVTNRLKILTKSFAFLWRLRQCRNLIRPETGFPLAMCLAILAHTATSFTVQ